jgi:hypothetical protein
MLLYHGLSGRGFSMEDSLMSQRSMRELKLRISVGDEEIRVRHLAALLAASNSLYETLALAALNPEAFDSPLSLPAINDIYSLRIRAIESGSDVNLVYFGLDKALDVFPRILEIIRDWGANRALAKARSEQEHQKAEQEKQKTIQETIRTLKAGRLFVEELPVSAGAKERIYAEIVRHAMEIDDVPHRMLPR